MVLQENCPCSTSQAVIYLGGNRIFFREIEEKNIIPCWEVSLVVSCLAGRNAPLQARCSISDEKLSVAAVYISVNVSVQLLAVTVFYTNIFNISNICILQGK